MNLNILYKRIKEEKGSLSYAKELQMKFPDRVNPQAIEIAEKFIERLITDYKMAGGKRSV